VTLSTGTINSGAGATLSLGVVSGASPASLLISTGAPTVTVAGVTINSFQQNTGVLTGTATATITPATFIFGGQITVNVGASGSFAPTTAVTVGNGASSTVTTTYVPCPLPSFCFWSDVRRIN
jgi:hypothetical protein